MGKFSQFEILTYLLYWSKNISKIKDVIPTKYLILLTCIPQILLILILKLSLSFSRNFNVRCLLSYHWSQSGRRRADILSRLRHTNEKVTICTYIVFSSCNSTIVFSSCNSTPQTFLFDNTIDGPAWPYVCRSLADRSVCHSFLNGQNFTLPCS